MKLVLKDLLQWADQKLEQVKLTEFLGSQALGRLRGGLGGSHTVVTYPPLDALGSIALREILEAVKPDPAVNFYAHIAFCEFLCPFCHYDTEFSKLGMSEPPRVIKYLDALETEIRSWKNLLKQSRIDSIYLGGGTPTSVSADRLVRLITLISEMGFNSPNATVCIETSPLTTVAVDGRAKLDALVDVGVNRFSIGVQTFNSQLLRRTRGHSQSTALKALSILNEVTDNLNIDMIQDLPDSGVEETLRDLESISEMKPAQVTWYILRIRPEAAWYGRVRRRGLSLTSTYESCRRSLLIREGMRRIGYFAKSGGRFVRDEEKSDHFKAVRSGLDQTMLGVGASAYSHGWGRIFRNTHSRQNFNGISNYVDMVTRTGFAIETGAVLNETEVAAARLVKGIRTGVTLPVASEEDLSYLKSARAVLNDMVRAGVVEETDDNTFRLTELGRLFEEEVCARFYSQDVQARLREKALEV